MQSLPDEMLLHIMSFLRPQELLETAALVCRRWEDLALNNALWDASVGYCYHTPGSQQLSEASAGGQLETAAAYCTRTGGSVMIHEAEAEVSNYPAKMLRNTMIDDDVQQAWGRDGCASGGSSLCAEGRPQRPLHTLVLRGRNDVKQVLRKWRRCSTLERLDLHECRLPPDALRALAGAFPRLQALSLRESVPLRAGIKYRQLANFKHLNALNFALCKGLPKGTVGRVARNCEALEELRCEWAEIITDEDVHELVTRRGHQLRVLVLGGDALTNESYRLLARCPRLQELGLAPCAEMQDRAMLQGVTGLSQLHTLQLTDAASITNIGLCQLLARLASAPRLRNFNLSWCAEADDYAIEMLANRCPALERVTLRQVPKLEDRGVAALLRSCKRLTNLRLVWNDSISGRRFLPMVADMAEFAPSLNVLDLSYCDNIPKEFFRDDPADILRAIEESSSAYEVKAEETPDDINVYLRRKPVQISEND